MILYVLRHGIAEDVQPGTGDAERRLTPRGRARMQVQAAGMRKLGIELDVLLTSPLRRAMETADIVARAYGERPAPRQLPALATGVPPGETLRALRPFARHDNLAIVGHEPGLSTLVALLLSGSPEGFVLELKKGGLVALEVERLEPHGAILLWLMTPRQLRKIGR